jgi:hypothetical protein
VIREIEPFSLKRTGRTLYLERVFNFTPEMAQDVQIALYFMKKGEIHGVYTPPSQVSDIASECCVAIL